MKILDSDDLNQIGWAVELALKVKSGHAIGTENHEKAEKVISQCLDKLLKVDEDE